MLRIRATSLPIWLSRSLSWVHKQRIDQEIVSGKRVAFCMGVEDHQNASPEFMLSTLTMTLQAAVSSFSATLFQWGCHTNKGSEKNWSKKLDVAFIIETVFNSRLFLLSFLSFQTFLLLHDLSIKSLRVRKKNFVTVLESSQPVEARKHWEFAQFCVKKLY